MKKIAVITSTRAEFGLLLPLVKQLRTKENQDFVCQLIVTGTHLSREHGYTLTEINETGQRVDKTVKIRIDSFDELDIALNQADTIVKFTTLFIEERYDAIIILGDRYEMQMIAIAATNVRVPIIHLCGGDTTEGAIDESIRHSITKMSYLHLVTNDDSRRRVIQLGENPNRVHNVGSTSIDNILNMNLLSKREALDSVDMGDCRYAIGTYHPVTLENHDVEKDVMSLIKVVERHTDIEFIITKANADQGGDWINSILEREEQRIANLHVFSSLGIKRYLSLMKYAEFVIGNSSSGIVEAPAFRVPTVNIGDRQKGRLQSGSTINCGVSETEIESAIETVLSPEFCENLDKVISPYGDGYAAEKMAKIIEETIQLPIDLKKKFYDMEMS